MADSTKKDVVEVQVVNMKALEDMTIDEVDALSTEEVFEALRRAELREKVMEVQRKKVARNKEKQSIEDATLKAKQEAAVKAARQARCPHRKGGSTGKEDGTDVTDHAIAHHILPSGAHMLLCLRCGKEEYSWNPLTGQAETPGYRAMASLPTLNKTSGSTLFTLGYRPPKE